VLGVSSGEPFRSDVACREMRSRKRLPAAFSGVGTAVRCKVAFFFLGLARRKKKHYSSFIPKRRPGGSQLPPTAPKHDDSIGGGAKWSLARQSAPRFTKLGYQLIVLNFYPLKKYYCLVIEILYSTSNFFAFIILYIFYSIPITSIRAHLSDIFLLFSLITQRPRSPFSLTSPAHPP